MQLTTSEETYPLDKCRNITPALARLGDKWTVLVIVALREAPRRFNQLKRDIDGISQQMLTRTLKALERDGMLTRTILPTNPPQVQYELTPMGRSLSVPLLALGRWVHEHLGEIDVARQVFDDKKEVPALIRIRA
jgi:DNA-binding HxlR family transcriptional regulator